MAEQLSSSAALKSEVTIIAGFLGAGKTTLLKKILSWESDLSETVVLVNEFGDVGIDGSLLKNAGSDVVELTGGCICCTMKADLHQTLKKIWQEFNPKQIFIESTGVADPFMITDVFNDAELRDQMQVSKVVTVLDIELWEARDYFGPIFFNQLKQADLILLNKIDLANENKISQYLKEIHEMVPHSQVVPTVHCDVEPDIVLAGRTNIQELSNYDELHHHHHHHHNHELYGENRYGQE
ncbi:MAG: GTP-binding protein, partial [Deltaproteobacteria bacterium]|nr:GTP-binding protein [Deltaproteobacteria bacterium]